MGWGGGSGPAVLKPEVVGPLALWDCKNHTCTSAPVEGEGVAGLPGGEGGGGGVCQRPLLPAQITGWKPAAWQGRRPSQWRRVASASRSAGRPPRKAQVRPQHPGPSAQRGGRAPARAQPDSPACTLRTAGSKQCTCPRRKEAWPREPGNGEGGTGREVGDGGGQKGRKR